MIQSAGTPQSFQFDRYGPLLQPRTFVDTKDPCPVFDGITWHLFGSGGKSGTEVWNILHATAPTIDGPWEEHDPSILEGITGDHVAAPGVVRDAKEQLFHMFIQDEFMALGGNIRHLTSVDGHMFELLDTPLTSLKDTEEAGIYDPHPAEILGNKYIVYAGSQTFDFTGSYYIGRPNIFLAKSESGSWYGPWTRSGKILDHLDVIVHHNQIDDPDYEWGLEGPQLLELPNGQILLIAVCFLPGITRGKRQRVFFAVANNIRGPYRSLGPVIHPTDGLWGGNETGHAAALIENNEFHLFYQARGHKTPWRYGRAKMPLSTLLEAITV